MATDDEAAKFGKKNEETYVLYIYNFCIWIDLRTETLCDFCCCLNLIAPISSIFIWHLFREVENFIKANTQELAKDKWLCPLSGKKFRGPEFVRKHIMTKHGESVDNVRTEVSRKYSVFCCCFFCVWFDKYLIIQARLKIMFACKSIEWLHISY